MNKFLLIALMGLALVALCAGSKEHDTNLGVVDTAPEALKTMKLAAPAGLARRRRKNNKERKKRKQRKKQGEKIKKKKKTRKGKGKGKGKGKAKGQRNNKAEKQGTETIKKSEKQGRADCTGCLDLPLWNKIIKNFRRKGKIDNYIVQKGRAEAHQGILDGKLAKNDSFQTILHQLQQQGGGNTSGLVCPGGQESINTEMTATWAILDMCQANIIAACNNASVAAMKPDATVAATCEADMDAIGTIVNTCSRKKVEAESCACWKDEALPTKLDAISDCDYKTYQKAVTAQKKMCVSAFSACKTAQATAGRLIGTCNEDSTGLAFNLNALTNNKNNAVKVKAVVAAALAVVNGRRRVARAVPADCTELITRINAVKATLESNAYADVDQDVADIQAFDTSTCTAGVTGPGLQALEDAFDDLIDDFNEYIEEIQDMIEDLTGSTASDQVIAEATSTTTTTTAAPVTAGYRRRRQAIQDILKRVAM